VGTVVAFTRSVRVAFGLVIALSLSCGGSAPSPSYRNSTFVRGEEKFAVAPPSRWAQIPTNGDLAWREPAGEAVIAANATCRGHFDMPLQVLVNDLLIGTTEREVLLSETAPLDGREALHEVVTVRLDGVPLVYDLYVVKKDGCVYDLSLVTQPRAYEGVADTFVAFVSGFRGLGAGPGAGEER
jgi:hypothetical protein